MLRVKPAPVHPVATGPSSEARHSLALSGLISHIAGRPGCRILDLGAANGTNVAFLSRYPCKLHIADLYRSLRREGGPLPRAADQFDRALALQLPEGEFDLVLAWDFLDYLNEVQLEVLGRHLRRRTAPQARVFALISYLSEIPDRPYAFHIMDEETLRYADPSGLERPSPKYKEPELLRRLPDFAVETSFLLRHGVQEYVLVRTEQAAADEVVE
jgi:hypothetical protein